VAELRLELREGLRAGQARCRGRGEARRRTLPAGRARIEWTPKHLLRDLKLYVDLEFDPPPNLKAALGKLVGATVDLHLGRQNPQT
jgi:hypothetical protein